MQNDGTEISMGHSAQRRYGAGLGLLTAPLLTLLLISCSGSKESAPTVRSPETAVSGKESESAREKALQHFIDGSLYEMKGDYAQAILEYQDALRHDPNHAVYFALSKSYSRLNKLALAIEAGREAVRLSPEKLDYLRNLAEVYVAAFQLDSAAAVYEEVATRDSNNIEAWFTLASLHSGRKPLRALEIYEDITERFGDEWDVLAQIADLNNMLGQPEKAIGALERMLVIDPGNLELKRSLAQTYVRTKQYDKALPLYADLRESDPGNLDYLGELATVHLLQKEYRKAAELFELLLARDSVTVEAKLRIGESYFSQLQSDSTLLPVATSMFERIRDLHPDDWRPYWFLGAIGGISRDVLLTIQNFKKVTELATWNPDGWVYLATTYLQHEKFEEVVRVLEEAQRYVPDDYQVNLFLGIAYSRLQRTEDAMQVLDRAARMNTKDLRALTQLALIYDTQKRHAESDSLYEAALKVEPNNHLVLNNYGYSLADRNLQLDRALDMARRAVDAQPDNPSYLDTIGWIYFRLGKYEEAESYIKKAMERGEVSAIVHEHLGDIYSMTDKKALALEQWNIALKLDENNTALRQKIERGSL
jgi:tetratricopeptide (TPR) repeat protein